MCVAFMPMHLGCLLWAAMLASHSQAGRSQAPRVQELLDWLLDPFYPRCREKLIGRLHS
jgi:hypothetical protein